MLAAAAWMVAQALVARPQTTCIRWPLVVEQHRDCTAAAASLLRLVLRPPPPLTCYFVFVRGPSMSANDAQWHAGGPLYGPFFFRASPSPGVQPGGLLIVLPLTTLRKGGGMMGAD